MNSAEVPESITHTFLSSTLPWIPPSLPQASQSVFKGSCYIPHEYSLCLVKHSQFFQPLLIRCTFTPGHSYRWASKPKHHRSGVVWPVLLNRAGFLCPHPLCSVHCPAIPVAWNKILVLAMKPHQFVVLLIFSLRKMNNLHVCLVCFVPLQCLQSPGAPRKQVLYEHRRRCMKQP